MCERARPLEYRSVCSGKRIKLSTALNDPPTPDLIPRSEVQRDWKNRCVGQNCLNSR